MVSDDHTGSDGEKAPAPGDESLWTALRQVTAARIGLARSGASIATAPLLDFKLSHARARDAVHETLDAAKLLADISAIASAALVVESAADDRQCYLLRPDLGRRLSSQAESALAARAGRYDVACVVADGLSARAVQMHAPPVLAQVLPALQAEGLRVAPVVVVRHGRVAIGDAVAALLGADCVAVLIGERPGLSAPHSMGAYLTWQPGPQTTDAERNCISNIRPDGVGYNEAAFKLVHLLRAMRARRVSGVALKDETERNDQVAALIDERNAQRVK
jgi:ethanolamine ammonia-lyase small subunit